MLPRLVSIVLPVYNQADHIGAVVAAYTKELEGFPIDYEFVLAVNGSRDSSHAVCLDLARSDGRVRVIHSITGGWGLGVRLGLEAARGDLLCYTNSARTSGQILRQILDEALHHSGHVVKARRMDRQGLARRLGSWLYNWECRWLLGTDGQDVNGTPKCFPRQFSGLLTLRESGDLLDAELLALCARHGYPVVQIPVAFPPRFGGRSTTTLKSARKMLLGAWKLWRRVRRDA